MMPDPSPDTPSVCPTGDPTCPCPDGDACHYEAVDDTSAMTPPSPSVCPTGDGVRVDVVSAIHQFYGADDSDDQFNDWAEDLATEILSVMHATPAAPGSSSPDVAALAERLRDDALED